MNDESYLEVLGDAVTNPAQPRASGETIVHDGVEWKVSPLEQRIKAQFEQWCRRNAVAAIADEEQDGNIEAARMMMASYVEARSAGRYNWDGSVCRSAKADKPGLVHLLFLLLRRCQPKATEDDAVRIFKDAPVQAGAAIGWAVGNEVAPRKGAKTPEPTMDD